MKHATLLVVMLVLPMFGTAQAESPSSLEKLLLAQSSCSQRMGPYQSQYAAQTAARSYQNQGYNTSGVWGQGGVVSSWSNRRYFFNVFYPC